MPTRQEQPSLASKDNCTAIRSFLYCLSLQAIREPKPHRLGSSDSRYHPRQHEEPHLRSLSYLHVSIWPTNNQTRKVLLCLEFKRWLALTAVTPQLVPCTSRDMKGRQSSLSIIFFQNPLLRRDPSEMHSQSFSSVYGLSPHSFLLVARSLSRCRTADQKAW
jgi:hypothetical protein